MNVRNLPHTLLYRAELWPLTVMLLIRLDAAHHRWQRSILGVSWRNKLTEVELGNKPLTAFSQQGRKSCGLGVMTP